MSTELFFAVGTGMVLLGVCFVILDYFLSRESRRLRRPEIVGQSDQEMLVSIRKSEERRLVKFATTTYEAAVAHRMRRGGLLVIVIGAVLLLGALAFYLRNQNTLAGASVGLEEMSVGGDHARTAPFFSACDAALNHHDI